MNCWLEKDKSPREPAQDELTRAKARTGMQLLLLDESDYTVSVAASQITVDLGAFGKGFAVDRMVELLREWDVETAMVHAGFSSVYASGHLPDHSGWPVSISDPGGSAGILARVILCGQSLSGSGLQKGHHIIDPRSARPVTGKRATWALAADAATADALSTAFMVMSADEISDFCRRHDVGGVVFTTSDSTEEKTGNIDFYGNFPR
jgi:thiamine biosynthesis lipoprotein